MTSTGWTTWSTGTTSSVIWNVTIAVAPLPEPPIDPRLIDAIYEACAWLDLEPPIHSQASVQAARRRMARLYHPDVGGSIDVMQQINAAADFLLGCFTR